MTAAALVERVRALGITLEPAGDRLRVVSPKDRLPADLRAELIARKAEVLALLAGPTAAPPDPADVARRTAAFRARLEAWHQAGVPGVPLLRLPEAAAAPVTAGTCAGCGVALPAGRTWRCAACTGAVELVLGLRWEASA